MKFCYVDESTDSQGNRLQVMVGVVVDAHRLNRSRVEFAQIFDVIKGAYPAALRELKGSRILYGKGGWRDVDAELRKQVLRLFCDWVSERRHKLALSAIDIQKFQNNHPDDYPAELIERRADRNLWIAGAIHIALQLQKAHQALKQNKGHTVLIFDENKVVADKLNEVLYDPPSWADSYYERKKKQEPLDQIIDSAFFTKSHHAGLVQVSDVFAFILRRYAELTDYRVAPVYRDELADIETLAAKLVPCLLQKPHRWQTRKPGPCAKAFVDLAPSSLRSV